MTTEKKTYLVEKRSGERVKITVPEDWKVTFGPIAVGGRSGNSGSLALRFYESDTKQRAIFTGVESFRDLSIPVEIEEVTESGETSWVVTNDGAERKTKRKRDRSWRKEDA